TDLKSRIYQVNAKNKSDWGKEHPRSLPTPNKKFLDAQAAVSEAADEFLAPMKKVGIKGKVKGFRRAGVAAAAGAAVMVGVDAMMSDGAKADELHPQDLQKNETNQDEERSEVEIGTLGE
ncbi:MAG: hypothetical protein ACXVBE_15000, partial [Bdellovibrionota bacterium]